MTTETAAARRKGEVALSRALLALIVALLVWPWLAWPSINLAFRLLTGGSLSWHRDFTAAARRVIALQSVMAKAGFLESRLLVTT